MIFQYTWQAVLDGRKTQTRRVVKDGEYRKRGWVYTPAGHLKWRVGKTYAVQPARTRKAIARIEIAGIRRERAYAISDADAIAEGFASRSEFLALWEQMHGGDCDVWVLEFRLT